jgi:hypothetical protein
MENKIIKSILLIILLITVLGGFYYWKLRKEEMFIILHSLENKVYSPDVWSATILNLQKQDKEKDLFENKFCQEINVELKLQLKDTCWDNSSVADIDFLKKNYLVEQLWIFFDNDKKQIFELNNCLTEKKILENFNNIKKEEEMRIGEEVCISHKNIILGGGCAQFKKITKEDVDLLVMDLKNEIKNGLTRMKKFDKGHVESAFIKLQICDGEDIEVIEY